MFEKMTGKVVESTVVNPVKNLVIAFVAGAVTGGAVEATVHPMNKSGKYIARKATAGAGKVKGVFTKKTAEGGTVVPIVEAVGQ